MSPERAALLRSRWSSISIERQKRLVRLYIELCVNDSSENWLAFLQEQFDHELYGKKVRGSC